MTADDTSLPTSIPVGDAGLVGIARGAHARHTAGQGSRRADAWYQLRGHQLSGSANQGSGKGPTSTVVPVSAVRAQLAALIQPVVVISIGVALGLVDQQAAHTSGWLRVPALVASLILVAQGILSAQERDLPSDDRGGSEVLTESTEVVTVQQITTLRHPGMAVNRGPGGPSAKETVTTTKKVREGPQVMFFVMGLAVWLGLATLANPSAPRLLLLLSLLASFLLFAEAYKQMRGRA